MDFIYNQNVGDGANIFLTIIAVAIGLVAGLSYVDYVREKQKQKENQTH